MADDDSVSSKIMRVAFNESEIKRLKLRKSVDTILADTERGPHLKRTLGPWQLTFLGVGHIIGVGIFVLIGPAIGNWAGPSIIISMLIAAVTCGLVALCYSEFASMIPVAGSAYTYSYATFGEFFAWIIGWDLILEYAVGATAVAIGWSGYFYSLTAGFGVPFEWTHPPSVCDAGGTCGVINLPAIGIILFLTALMSRGAKEAANLNFVIVLIKLAAIAIFVLVAAALFNGNSFADFQPMGWSGTFTGAAIIFFAFIGFDAVSTAAEEAKNPAKDMKTAIVGSLGIASVVYVLVALTIVGLMTQGFGMAELGVSSSALADALSFHGQGTASALVAGGALFAITSVLLVSLYAQPRIFFALARDGLLPARFAKLSKRHVPSRTIWTTGLFVAFFAGFVGIGEAAELTNIGTLFAFILVSYGILRLRRERPDIHRPFKVPLFPWVPLAAIVLSLSLMMSLPFHSWIRFVGWLFLGVLIYAFYGLRHSKLAQRKGMVPPLPTKAPPEKKG